MSLFDFNSIDFRTPDFNPNARQSGLPDGGYGSSFGNNRLANPMLQIGLGILANNQGNYGNALTALGRGAQQGIQVSQRFKQNELQNAIRQQQIKNQQKIVEQRSKAYDLQSKRLEREAAKEAKAMEAGELWKQNNPEYASLFDVDKDSAIKLSNPSLTSSGTPSFRFLNSEDGIVVGDRRTGKITPALGANNKPIIGAQFSPDVQSAITTAKEKAKNAQTINGDIPSVLTTNANVIDQINGNAPSIEAQADVRAEYSPIKDELASQIKLLGTALPEEVPAIQANIAELNAKMESAPKGVAGISVPTKAEEAAEVESAKIQAKFNSPDAAKKRQKALDFKASTAKDVIRSIDDVMGKVDAWSAGAGGNVMRMLPFNNDAKDIAADVVTIKANFGFDRLQTMRDMSPTGGALGQVAVQELNALQSSVTNLDVENQSPEQLLKHLSTAKSHYERWLETITAESGGGDTSQASATDITPSEKAVKHLKMNPKLKADFDAKYGQGSADKALGK